MPLHASKPMRQKVRPKLPLPKEAIDAATTPPPLDPLPVVPARRRQPINTAKSKKPFRKNAPWNF